MACSCKKNAAAKANVTAAPKQSNPLQESTPEKKIGNRIIRREIR